MKIELTPPQARALRAAAATATALLATWATTIAVDLEPMEQSFVLMVMVPALMGTGKWLRMRADEPIDDDAMLNTLEYLTGQDAAARASHDAGVQRLIDRIDEIAADMDAEAGK